MKTVVVRGPLLSVSGYGVHARQIYKWLLKQPGIDIISAITPWGNTTWMITPEQEGGLIGEIMNRSRQQDRKADVSIQIQLPNEWSTDIADVNIGVTAGVETDVCNPKWIQDCNKMSAIVVPSKHVADTLRRTGTIFVPIHVVPESFPDEIVDQDNVFTKSLSTSFNFLLVGQLTGNNPWNDRKNTFQTIKWLCETFKDDQDVGIILKTNSGRCTSLDRAHTNSIVKKLLSEVRTGMFPRVHLLHGNLTTKEMCSIYKHESVKAYVNLSRGEGFGLPILEAAAAGLPVIATNWSGHLDFLSHGKFIPVDYRLSEIHQTRVDNAIFMQGSKWAEPWEEDAKRKLQKFKQKQSVPAQWAKELQTVILEKYSQEAIEKLYDQALGDIVK